MHYLLDNYTLFGMENLSHLPTLAIFAKVCYTVKN